MELNDLYHDLSGQRKLNAIEQDISFLYFCLNYNRGVSEGIEIKDKSIHQAVNNGLNHRKKCERPDYIVDLEGEVIGVEIANLPAVDELQMSKEANARIIQRKLYDSTIDSLKEKKKKIFLILHFNMQASISKKDISRLVQDIESFIFLHDSKIIDDRKIFNARNGLVGEEEGTYPLLPDALAPYFDYIEIVYNTTLENAQYGINMFPMDQLSRGHLPGQQVVAFERVLKQKDSKQYDKCTHCKEVWLVVRDMSEWSLVANDLRQYSCNYESKMFKRAYLIESPHYSLIDQSDPSNRLEKVAKIPKMRRMF